MLNSDRIKTSGMQLLNRKVHRFIEWILIAKQSVDTFCSTLLHIGTVVFILENLTEKIKQFSY